MSCHFALLISWILVMGLDSARAGGSTERHVGATRRVDVFGYRHRLLRSPYPTSQNVDHDCCRWSRAEQDRTGQDDLLGDFEFHVSVTPIRTTASFEHDHGLFCSSGRLPRAYSVHTEYVVDKLEIHFSVHLCRMASKYVMAYF